MLFYKSQGYPLAAFAGARALRARVRGRARGCGARGYPIHDPSDAQLFHFNRTFCPFNRTVHPGEASWKVVEGKELRRRKEGGEGRRGWSPPPRGEEDDARYG